MSPISFADARFYRRARLAALVGVLLVAAPLAASAGGSHSKSSSTYGYSTGSQGEQFSWGLLDPSGGDTMSGTVGDDWRDIQRLMRDEDLPVFWFRRDGRHYLVRDPALVAHATELAEPMLELGRKQGALGGKQGALGGRQAAIGGRQAAIGAQQARLSLQLAGLTSYGSSGSERAAARERREIEEALEELSDQQSELGREQVPLGRLQAELGREQAALGRQQAQLSKEVGEQIRRLAEDAVKSGKAEPLKVRKSI
ncbi:MAG: hypothetical protein ABIS67_14265 [Candidatus Eisenbacteria bacterium]